MKRAKRVLLFCIALLCAALLCTACRQPPFFYVELGDAGGLEAERAFFESLFAEGGDLEALGLRLLPPDGGGAKGRPSLLIEFFSSFEYEGLGARDILISRTPLVPKENPLAGRTDTSLAACLGGAEALIPPGEIAPPFTALRVDGLALGDSGYPLVRTAGVRIPEALNPAHKREEKKFKALNEKIPLLQEFLEAADKPLVHADPEPVWIALGGDVMLDRGASEILFKEGPAGIFGGTAQMLASADIAIINLEGVISARGEKTPKAYNFRFAPETAPALKKAGIDAVLHANNHVYDYGKDAFLDSLARLAQEGVGAIGAGIDDEAASNPFVFKKGGDAYHVFGIASFPRERSGWDGASAAAGPGQPGMLHAERGGMEKIIAKFTPGALDVVLFHGGIEWASRPDSATRKRYTDLVAAGADLIIGSHPHIVQGFEWVMDKPVFWSLGNYVFGGMDETDGGEDGLFIRLGYWQNRLLYLEPFPLALEGSRAEIAANEKLERFYALSRALQE